MEEVEGDARGCGDVAVVVLKADVCAGAVVDAK